VDGFKDIDVLKVGGKLAEMQVGGVLVLLESEVDVGLAVMALAKSDREFTVHEVNEVISKVVEKERCVGGHHAHNIDAG
jgi:hypothetical protein